MKPWAIIMLSIVLVAGTIAWLVVGVYGIWPPDFDGRKLTLASATAPDGTRLRVEQYWNHIDFYSTDFYATPPGGKTVKYVIDGDDRKRWRGEIQISGTSARIVVGREEQGVYDLKRGVFLESGRPAEGLEQP